MNATGKKLLEELYKDPKKFAKKGKGYNLYIAYCEGFDMATLSLMLESKDDYILSNALWILTELGIGAADFIEQIAPFISSSYISEIRYYALECIGVCANEKYSGYFKLVPEMLTDNDMDLRHLSMTLLSNVDGSVIKSAINYFEMQEKYGDRENHLTGLNMILNWQTLNTGKVFELVYGSDPLLRKYSAIVARKHLQLLNNPELVKIGLRSVDPDIRSFCEDSIYILSDDDNI